MWRYFAEQWPITSVRRAITNLERDGHLEKTSKQGPGLYGRPEYHWKWKTQAQEPQQLTLL